MKPVQPEMICLPSDLKKIGFFDSGIGGLSILNAVIKTHPAECIYVADTAYLPYGNKPKEVLIERGRVVIKTLKTHGIDTIIIACHTSSAHCLETLKAEFPEVTLIDMLLPTVHAAAAITKNKRVGIIATTGTISTHAHKKLFEGHAPEIAVFEQACPKLVPLVESRTTTNEERAAALKEYLTPLQEQTIDTLILGCTHYAFLKDAIHQIAPELTLISAGGCIAPGITPAEQGPVTFLTSGEGDYSESIKQFLGTTSRTLKFERF